MPTTEEIAASARKAGTIRWQRARGDRRLLPCEQCGISFHVQPSDIQRRFCSLKCRRDWERKNKTCGNYKTAQEVINEHSIPEPNSGCWIWLGKWDEQCYGKVNRRGVYQGSAHKLSFAAFDPEEREIAEVFKSLIGLELDHKCNLRCCVNWQHLEPVTHTENVRRAVANRWPSTK